MSSRTINESNLSSLDQVRKTEADVTRQIASAREAAGQKVARAQTQANDLLDDARQVGKREGEKRYKAIISNAEEEAQVIIAQSHNRAAHLRRRAGKRFALGVRYSLNIIIGLEDTGEYK